MRFEHCNRLDLDEQATKSDCKKCWTTWLTDYTYGQPRDRIDYARRRALALSNGEAERPALRFDEAPAEARQFYMVVPGPTSVRKAGSTSRRSPAVSVLRGGTRTHALAA